MPEPFRPIKPNCFAARYLGGDVPERPDIGRLRLAALDEEILERARVARVHTKAASNAFDTDLANLHGGLEYARRWSESASTRFPRGRSRFDGSRTTSRSSGQESQRARASASRTPARRHGVPDGHEGIQLAYHWLDPLGNAIVWDGARTALPGVVRPGETVELESPLVAPRPPGRYRLAFDLVEEFRFWFQELGSTPLDLPVDVRPLIEERRLTVNVYGPLDAELEAALSAQQEPLVTEDAVAVAHLVSGVVPAADWSRLVLDAHAEGYAAVGPAVEAESRGDRRSLSAWAPGGGRNPRFGEPLLLPSLLEGLEPSMHEGLPAYAGRDGLFEGRAVVRLRSRSGRRTG